MARTRATENARSRPKPVLIEEIGRGIKQFQDIITSIEDFSREGFPYRDAARAKAELQLRECVRRIFGERSSEFQTYRNYRLRTSTKEDTAQSLAVVKSLIHTLGEKKAELQGSTPAAKDAPDAEPPTMPPPLTLVPPAIATSSAPPPPASVCILTKPSAPAPAPSSDLAHSGTRMKAHQTPMAAPIETPSPETLPVLPQPTSSSPDDSPPASAPSRRGNALPPSSVVMAPPTPQQPPAPVNHAAAEPPAPTAAETVTPSAPRIHPVLASSASAEQDPLELVRKVCLRFHAVTRQLRLRKDYRATLEVEDDYDLQDLLCALLKVEFDEVVIDEWTPPYTGGAPRTTFLLHRDHIAVSAKKTRPGLTTRELTDQVTADSARYSVRPSCHTLFCFIYDPEGRIGSPRRLETDLTSVSDRYMIEVLVAPK
jgi:DpnII restriction endonuclease